MGEGGCWSECDEGGERCHGQGLGGERAFGMCCFLSTYGSDESCLHLCMPKGNIMYLFKGTCRKSPLQQIRSNLNIHGDKNQIGNYPYTHQQ